MFNKPALFPKTPEPQPARGARTGPGSFAPNSASSMSSSQSEASLAHKETVTNEAGSVGKGLTASAGSAATASEDAAHDSGSRLIVGPDVKLKGAEILDCDTLVVEGRVEATMDSRVIRIAENGSFAGTVGIDVAEVHGRFEGELTARSQLIIHATGRVSGKIRYGKILIEEGGEISGDVQSLSSTAKEKEKEKDRGMERVDGPAKVSVLGG
jgi:cytoskeletal protein CcmA (bactofilin family)